MTSRCGRLGTRQGTPPAAALRGPDGLPLTRAFRRLALGGHDPTPRAEEPMSATDKPTSKQLAYLRRLAVSRGQTFRTPHTRAEASAEIKRLRSLAPNSRRERAIERIDGERHVRREGFDAAAVRPDEVEGYGADATWSGQR